MSKWLVAVTVGVLVVALVVVVLVFSRQVSKLKTDMVDAENRIAALQSEVSRAQGTLSSLQGELAEEKKRSSGLSADLTGARTRISALEQTVDSQDGTIRAQAAELKTMKYPRHFNSMIELTNWLQKDDTNVRYAGLPGPQIAFILQIRALREGYLLPVRLPLAGSLEYITNMAVIGDVVYSVRGTDDFVERWGTVSPGLPSYPILPESGQ